jgi:hypothetical protein
VTADILINNEQWLILEVSTHFHSIYQCSLRSGGINMPLKSWFAWCAQMSDWKQHLFQSSDGVHTGLYLHRLCRSGTIKYIRGLDEIRDTYGIADIDVRVSEGDGFIGSSEAPGVAAIFWGMADSSQRLISIFQRAVEKFEITWEE